MAESSPHDRLVPPDSPGGSPAAFPRWSAAQQAGSHELDPSPILLPGPDESPGAYLARLQALHRRLGALIHTIEQRRDVRPEPPAPRVPFNAAAAVSLPARAAVTAPPPPLAPRPVRPPVAPTPPAQPVDDGPPWPERERRIGQERRVGATERRIGVHDRRRGQADMRQLRTERRAGPRDRRTGPSDRRRDIQRRRSVNSLPWERGRLSLDATTLVWIVQVLAWAAIAVVALVYGLGHT